MKEFGRYQEEEKTPEGKDAGTLGTFVNLSRRLFPEESFRKAWKLLAAAEKAAAGDKIATARVDFLKKGLKEAQMTVAVRIAQKAMEADSNPRARAGFQKALNDLCAYRKSIENDHVCN